MRPVLFVMTDVVGSTALWETHGDSMRSALETHDGLVHGAMQSAGGRVFKHTGDGMIAVFDDADGAVEGALHAAGALMSAQWGDTGPLRVRMSVHAGTASERDGDFFGPPVNKVARINGIGHGGQVLASDVARQLMSQPSGIDLGVHQLRDLSEPVRLWQLDDGDYPALRTLKAARHNLPVMPTGFIGRQAEVDELRALVGDHRLVTISGVGGCGKTRLAIEVAAASADKFPGGVWFVDLTTERDGNKVRDRVNAALGVVEPLESQRSEPAAVLDEATAGLATLVIVDNCEHLIDDVAEFAEAVLAQAASVSVLTTSREALAVDGERVWRIPNMHDDAVELFVDRATAVGVSGLTDHLDRIEEICVQLDDIPLAIELAAARVASLSVDGLAERLDDRFSLLGGGRGRQRQRQRQQTLQTMMDWSYGLLNNEEQHVLNQLAVFSGTFPLSGAEAVATPERIPVLSVLDSLVAQSLVVPSVDSGRYRLLETVRLYALDRLVAAEEANITRMRHLEWVLTVARRGSNGEPGMSFQHEEDKLVEIFNITAAMEWADETGNSEAVLDLFRGAQSCWSSGGNLGRVGASWRDRIPLPPADEPTRHAGWLSTSAVIDFNLGESVGVAQQVYEAATIVDALIESDPYGDWLDSVVVLYFRGVTATVTGRIETALREADRLDELPQDPTGYARFYAAHIRALALLPERNAESMAATVAMVEASRSVSPWAAAISSSMLGVHLCRIGSHEESVAALRLCLESEAMSESVKLIQLPNLAKPLSALGRYGEALHIVEMDFGPMMDTQARDRRVYQLMSLAILLHGLDQHERRDHIAAIAVGLGPRGIAAQNLAVSLGEIFGSEEAVDALPEPGSDELTTGRVTTLIADVIIEIRDQIAASATGTLNKAAS